MLKAKKTIICSLIFGVFAFLFLFANSALALNWCPYPFRSHYHIDAPAECTWKVLCGTKCKTKWQCGPAGEELDLRWYNDLSEEDFNSWSCHQRFIAPDYPALGEVCKQCDLSSPDADCRESLCMIDKDATDNCEQSNRCISIPTMKTGETIAEQTVGDNRMRDLGMYTFQNIKNAYTAHLSNPNDWRWGGSSAFRCNAADDCCYNGPLKIKSEYPIPYSEGASFEYNRAQTFFLEIAPDTINNWDEWNQFKSNPPCTNVWTGCRHGTRATRNDTFGTLWYRNGAPPQINCSQMLDPFLYKNNSKCDNCPQYGTCGEKPPGLDPNSSYVMYKYVYPVYVNSNPNDCTLNPANPGGSTVGYYYNPNSLHIKYHVVVDNPYTGQRDRIGYFATCKPQGTNPYCWWESGSNIVAWDEGATYRIQGNSNFPCVTETASLCGQDMNAKLFDYVVRDIEKCGGID